MGLFKKLTVRNKTKSTWDLSENNLTRHEFAVPKHTARPLPFTYVPAPPPYELEAELGNADSDPGNILIGIDFGTT